MMKNNKVKGFSILNINEFKFKTLKFIFFLMILIPFNQVISYETQANSDIEKRAVEVIGKSDRGLERIELAQSETSQAVTFKIAQRVSDRGSERVDPVRFKEEASQAVPFRSGREGHHSRGTMNDGHGYSQGTMNDGHGYSQGKSNYRHSRRRVNYGHPQGWAKARQKILHEKKRALSNLNNVKQPLYTRIARIQKDLYYWIKYERIQSIKNKAQGLMKRSQAIQRGLDEVSDVRVLYKIKMQISDLAVTVEKVKDEKIAILKGKNRSRTSTTFKSRRSEQNKDMEASLR